METNYKCTIYQLYIYTTNEYLALPRKNVFLDVFDAIFHMKGRDLYADKVMELPH